MANRVKFLHQVQMLVMTNMESILGLFRSMKTVPTIYNMITKLSYHPNFNVNRRNKDSLIIVFRRKFYYWH